MLLEVALYGFALLLAGAGMQMIRRVDPSATETHVPVRAGTLKSLEWPSVDSLESFSDAVAALDPFRVSHRPSTVAFGAGVQLAIGPSISRPLLRLTGLIGEGTHWLAVVGGIPGRSGDVLLAEGDTIAGLQVIRVQKDATTIRGADTTWTLNLKRVW